MRTCREQAHTSTSNAPHRAYTHSNRSLRYSRKEERVKRNRESNLDPKLTRLLIRRRDSLLAPVRDGPPLPPKSQEPKEHNEPERDAFQHPKDVRGRKVEFDGPDGVGPGEFF